MWSSSIHPLSILYPSNRPSFPHLRDAKTYPKRTEHPDPWVSTMAGFNSSNATKVEIYDPCPAISPILQNHTQNPISPKSCNQTKSVINLIPFILPSPKSDLDLGEVPKAEGVALLFPHRMIRPRRLKILHHLLVEQIRRTRQIAELFQPFLHDLKMCL